MGDPEHNPASSCLLLPASLAKIEASYQKMEAQGIQLPVRVKRDQRILHCPQVYWVCRGPLIHIHGPSEPWVLVEADEIVASNLEVRKLSLRQEKGFDLSVKAQN